MKLDIEILHVPEDSGRYIANVDMFVLFFLFFFVFFCTDYKVSLVLGPSISAGIVK